MVFLPLRHRRASAKLWDSSHVCSVIELGWEKTSCLRLWRAVAYQDRQFWTKSNHDLTAAPAWYGPTAPQDSRLLLQISILDSKSPNTTSASSPQDSMSVLRLPLQGWPTDILLPGLKFTQALCSVNLNNEAHHPSQSFWRKIKIIERHTMRTIDNKISISRMFLNGHLSMENLESRTLNAQLQTESFQERAPPASSMSSIQCLLSSSTRAKFYKRRSGSPTQQKFD